MEIHPNVLTSAPSTAPRRDFHLYLIHKSLSEWLLGGRLDGDSSAGEDGAAAPPLIAVDPHAGHAAWADHCARFALGRRTAEARAEAVQADPYSLRYVVQHLTAARRWGDLAEGLLLDLDYWEIVFSAGGLEFCIVEDVVEANRALDAAVAAAEADEEEAEGSGMSASSLRAHAAVCADVLRWLLADGRFMRQDPRAVVQCALAAPLASAVSRAARAFHRQPPLRLANPPAVWPAEVMLVESPGRRLVRSVCCSPDGELLVSSSGPDAHIRWAATGQLVAPLLGHARDVTACAWSADGLLVATASEDRTLRVFDALTGHLNLVLEGHAGSVGSCCFVGGGSERVVSSSFDGTVRLWDCRAGGPQLRVVAGSEGGVGFACAAVAPDGARVATTRMDNAVAVFEVASGASVWAAPAGSHTDRVVTCCYSPDGRHVCSCSWDTTLVLWHADSGEALWTMRGHPYAVKGCCFSACGGFVLSASDDFTVKVWSLRGRREVSTLVGHSDRVGCAASGPNSRAYSGSRDGTLRCVVQNLRLSLVLPGRPRAF